MQVTLSEPMGEISTQSPTFSWQEAKVAAGYAIQVSSNEDFSNAWSTTVGNTTVQYFGSEQLEFSQEYYWRIMPLNQDEEEIGNWSEAGSFIITTANIVTLTSPVNTEVFSLTPIISIPYFIVSILLISSTKEANLVLSSPKREK